MERRSGSDRRRPGPTPRFPFLDAQGQWVTSDRRRIADRRLTGLSGEQFWSQMARAMLFGRERSVPRGRLIR